MLDGVFGQDGLEGERFWHVSWGMMNLEGSGEKGTGTLMGVGVYATRDAFTIYSVLGQVDLRWSLRQRRKILCAQVSLQGRVRRRRCSDAAEQNSKTCFAGIGGRV